MRGLRKFNFYAVFLKTLPRMLYSKIKKDFKKEDDIGCKKDLT